MAMDVVDYEIKGAEMQFVEVELDPGEAAIGEAGSMMFMDAGIAMDTVFGDGSNAGGGFFGKLLGAGKRLVTGESLFTTVYTNAASTKQRVAFAAPYPGKILPMELKKLGGMLVCQKDSFLCAARGVSLGIYFQQKLSVGFFGGEEAVDEAYRNIQELKKVPDLLRNPPKLLESTILMFGSDQARKAYSDWQEIETGERPVWDYF